jgi:hypothetical protein
MKRAVALANNDVVFVAWSFEEAIPECLGFAVRRTSEQDGKEVLPAWVGFHGESNPDWNPSDTEKWPVQKYAWRDLTADRGKTYRYEIIPRVGRPGDLSSRDDLKLVTDFVTLTPSCSEHVDAYFNRGILSTQALAHVLPIDKKGMPSSEALLEAIKRPGDPVRAALAGQIIEALRRLPKEAVAEGKRCHGALYELNDPELVEMLKDPEHLALVLSNAGEGDSTNKEAREDLHGADVEVTDRMMSSGHIGHNKFLVGDGNGDSPPKVLTGSTNWTYTGLCAQANNALVLGSEQLASTYMDFWKRLKEECPPPPAKAAQGEEFRKTNNEAFHCEIDGAEVTLRLSPNTRLQSKPKDNPPAPDDMTEAFELIASAKRGIFFLLFQPGSPSVLDAIGTAEAENPLLFVRGAATDPEAIENYETTLYHRTGERAQVAGAAGLDHPFAGLQQELLKSSPKAHAIIHDKIIVIDPHSSEDCVVITGSHNLGYRASYANDENLLIIKGHQPLASSYVTHVMDIYDHYRWRWRSRRWKAEDGQRPATEGGSSGGLSTTDCWQEKYYRDQAIAQEREFWLRSS